MVDNLKNTAVYTDFQGLAELRRMSRKGGEASLRAVARQFESLFMQMMLKSMRDAMPVEDGIFNSSEMRTYMDMYDKQLALNLADKGGIGLADMLVKQLSGQGINAHVQVRNNIQDYVKSPLPAHSAASNVKPVDSGEKIGNRVVTPQSTKEIENKPAIESKDTGKDMTPEDFVRSLWGYAKDVAKKYGLNAKAMIAQAALETGWGKHIMQKNGGASSNNLFGIKAGSEWTGGKVNVSTLEYSNGVFNKQAETFRSYASIADSIRDYAKFISSKPRYSGISQYSNNPEAYAEHLQKTGYATDPDYASKIKKILRSGVLENALSRTGI